MSENKNAKSAKRFFNAAICQKILNQCGNTQTAVTGQKVKNRGRKSLKDL